MKVIMTEKTNEIGKAFSVQVEQYIRLHLRPKSKRMHQKTYDKMLKTVLQLTIKE